MTPETAEFIISLVQAVGAFVITGMMIYYFLRD